MLDDFKETQKIAYKTIINSSKKESFSHAYLIELNNNQLGLEFVYSFAKFLLCPNHNSNNESCKNCNQCKLIDENNFVELKKIVADGKFIKKAQLSELKNEFSRKAVATKYKVYVIEEAEKLNEESSNCILKFLEEPAEGIIAILLTNNIYQVLGTIKSRCQLITLSPMKEIETSNTLEKIAKYLYNDSLKEQKFIEIGSEKLENIISYVDYYERNGLNSIIFKNKNILSIIDDDFTLDNLFSVLILVYKDILNIFLKRDMDYFNDYEEILSSIVSKTDLIKLTKKMKVLIDLSSKIKYNVNASLIMDKLIIDMEA